MLDTESELPQDDSGSLTSEADSPVHGVRVLTQQSFDDAFGAVFPLLSGLHWIANSDSFLYPNEWLDQSTFDAHSDSFVGGVIEEFESRVRFIREAENPSSQHIVGYYAAFDLFPQYCRPVSEDWNSIFAVSPDTADPADWLRAYQSARPRWNWLEHNCVAAFLNVDGAFWELYAADETLIQHFARKLADAKLNHERRFLAQCDYL